MAEKEKSQSEKFIKKAKALDVDDEESAEASERSFKRIASVKDHQKEQTGLVTYRKNNHS